MRSGRILSILLAAAFASGQNKLVNMIPNSWSADTSNDSEPTISVDPNSASRMVGSAFTWDNVTGAPMVTNKAPLYVSTDGGLTWTLSMIVPSQIGAFPTGDITHNFSSSAGAGSHPSSWLYAGILGAASSYGVVVLRTQDPYGSTVMTSLDTHNGNVDQPHTTAKTNGTQDRLYVGFNNGYGCLSAPNGRSSTVDVSQDAKAASPTFTLDVIDARNNTCQDGFAQVVAAHADGTVYAAFIRSWNSSPQLIVVRDDGWASGASPFTALTDTSDSKAGKIVANVTLPSGSMGQQRLGASNVSIAVDPNNSSRVYVAWGASNGANSETVHVSRSDDRGVTWTDLGSVDSAMNPEVAVANSGVVGLLYQKVESSRWKTYLAQASATATGFSLPGTLLANQDATTPALTYAVYIGDYASLTTSPNGNFVGMFAASNYPDKANFMTGVRFQREVDWTTHKLYSDAAHTHEVTTSIDPYYFEIGPNLCARFPIICENICIRHIEACFPIYDPWWWLKCPQCGITIYVNPGDPDPTILQQINVFDTRGQQVGKLTKLQRPFVANGMRYTYAVRLRQEKGVGYVLRREGAVRGKMAAAFNPRYLVQVQQQR